MTRHLTTLCLCALVATGCTVVSHNRAFPKLDWYWSKDAQQQRQEIKQEKLLTPQPVATSAARVQLSAVVAVPPAQLPQCPPLHWQQSNGWGGLVISGPAVETLDYAHCGCPQYPGLNTIRAWLTETTDYVLPVQKTGMEFARIVPFATD